MIAKPSLLRALISSASPSSDAGLYASLSAPRGKASISWWYGVVRLALSRPVTLTVPRSPKSAHSTGEHRPQVIRCGNGCRFGQNMICGAVPRMARSVSSVSGIMSAISFLLLTIAPCLAADSPRG